MKTIIIDYPTNFTFRTKKTFSNDEERTLYLHKVLKRDRVESPCHLYTDYSVEFVETLSNGTEFWGIGS